ncbi:hypothetical protein PAXRUDRAFT_167611 [Paxillus rubicundulus Ve08.2h10]|uniref:Uncharacterized protein n=1 Tax=Paxillus rubicundulus Ve08.2h10 TaxID=930991 RepID=A0A0D0D9L1_9AGAM|nr:hypothetical protein PAXRUDRAFT_167611 [Paxillus rubicundulus Ve08.2h10]
MLSYIRPDCIVCLDVCFTQKHTHNPRNGAVQDPPNPTDTVFVAAHDVHAMEAFVKVKRQSHSKKRKGQSPEDTLDGYEEGMRVPISVLDGCGELFLAANEKHQKASTHFLQTLD